MTHWKSVFRLAVVAFCSPCINHCLKWDAWNYSGKAIDVTKWKFNQVLGKLKGDVSKVVYYFLPLLTADLG